MGIKFVNLFNKLEKVKSKMLNTRKVLNKDLNQLKNDFLKDLNNFYNDFERTLNVNLVTTGFNNYKNLKELILHAIHFDNKAYDI